MILDRHSSASAKSQRAKRTLASATLAAAGLALVGCAGLPSNMAMPHRLLNAETEPSSQSAPVEWPVRNAWDEWSDPVLEALIAKALNEQPGLQQLRSRVEQADAAVQGTDAAGRPQVKAGVDLSYQRFTENGLVPAPLAGSLEWNNSAQFSASWEWDLFGRQRAALAATVGQARAASAESHAAAVLLSARIAASYVELAHQIEKRDITSSALVQRRQVLGLVSQRIGAGLDSTVDLRQAETVLAQTEVELEAANEGIARNRHALAELSGQRPDALLGLTPRLAPVRQQALPASLPVDLLGRRADLVAQRWRVEAASQGVALARAQFYPNVNLVAFAGLSSLGLDRLIRSGSATYGVGPALSLPIFDGGRLRANLRSKAAEVDIAVEGYNASLLAALREVADELVSLQSIERQQMAQARALESAEAAFDLATQRYRAGLGNFLVVLTADANVLAQRRASSDLKARHLASEVALSRALGGGWHSDEATLARLSQQSIQAIRAAERQP